MAPIDLFIGAVVSPLTTELAAVTRSMDGIGCRSLLLLDSLGSVSCVLIQGAATGGLTDAHTYGVFNMIYGLGNTGKYFNVQTRERYIVSWSVADMHS